MKKSSVSKIDKYLIFAFFAFFYFGITSNVNSQTYSWTQKADYGGGETYDPFSFVIGNKAYVGTGRAIPSIVKDDFWEYDPQTDVWTQKADFLGSGRYGAKAFSIGNFGYAGTGWTPTGTTTFYKYDPQNNVWTAVTNFGGSQRYTSTSFSIDNFGYLGLGYSPYTNDFWRFDPILNSWAQTASFPGSARQAASAFTINGMAYVGAGNQNASNFQDFYKYDPSNNTWTPIASFPGVARCAAFSFSLGTDGYFGMGYNFQNSTSLPYSIFKDFWKYDSNTDSWAQLPDFPGGKLYAGVSFAIGNKGYVGMGSDTILSTHYVDNFWEYGLTTGINDIAEASQNFLCYPNPVTDKFTIKWSSDFKTNSTAQIQIYDVRGKLVKSSNINNATNLIELDVSGLSKGNYSLSLVQHSAVVAQSKFTKL